MVVAIRRLEQRDLARAYAAWYSRVFDEQEAASAYEVAFRRLRHQEAAKAFAKWADAAESALRAREMLAASLVTMRIAPSSRPLSFSSSC